MENSSSECIYVIVRAKSVRKLQKLINDMIEVGWTSDNLKKTIKGWQPVGGVTFDGKEYLQAMMHCD